MMNLHKEAELIARDAWTESCFDEDTAREYIWQSCDGHEIAIYYHKAIQFCADQNTDDGEQWVEDCAGFTKGMTFGDMACRIAFATLLLTCEESLADIISDYEESEL